MKIFRFQFFFLFLFMIVQMFVEAKHIVLLQPGEFFNISESFEVSDTVSYIATPRFKLDDSE